MTQKLTPWFSTDIKPTRKGWYDVMYDGETIPYNYRYWFDGKHWLLEESPSLRTEFGNKPPADQWRGIAEKP